MPQTTPQTPEIETRDRVRRIETRLTSLMIGLDIKTGAQKPEFANGKLTIRSPHTSLKEILDSIPAGWQYSVDVFLNTRKVTTIHVGELS